MNSEHSTTYFQRIWHKIKRALSKPQQIRKTEYFLSNDSEKVNYEPPNKKLKLDKMTKSLQDNFDKVAFVEVMKKLLTCSVCLEVRKQANQCQNGHLICVNCTISLEQSSSTKEINCPVCRVPLTGVYQRSLLVEQLVSELPTKCRFCADTMSVRKLSQHELEICPARTINCQYALFGCIWKGVAKQRKFHESICKVGLSTVALAYETGYSNLKNRLSCYEKRNNKWQTMVNKLKERNAGMTMFVKHLVLSKYKDQPNIKSSFKTTKLEIFFNQFQLKLSIIKDKKTQNRAVLYKLKYLDKQTVTVNFFLHAIRYDDEILEMDDNLHFCVFLSEEQQAGAYSIHFSPHKLEENPSLIDTLTNKDSLYVEIVFMIESSESLNNTSGTNALPDALVSNSQSLANTRTTNPNPGNLVVALISSDSLLSQSNETNEDETEQYNVENVEQQTDPEDEDNDEEEAEDDGDPEAEDEEVSNDGDCVQPDCEEETKENTESNEETLK